MKGTSIQTHPRRILYRLSALLGVGLCVFLLTLTACEDDPILSPTDNSDLGGSYGKFEQPDSTHLLENLSNPATF